MDNRTRYVYKIFDKLNEDKFYIGTTFNVEIRWNQHKKDSNSKKLNADMLEFGTQDFGIETIFEGTEHEVYEKEIELIKELKPYYNNKYDNGGKLTEYTVGEKHPEHKLVDKDIPIICDRIINNEEQISHVAKDYKVNHSTIARVVYGKTWRHINIPRIKIGEIINKTNGMSKITEQDVKDICERVVINKESVQKVKNDYPHIHVASIYNIVSGKTWKQVNAPRRNKKEEIISIRLLAKNGINYKEIISELNLQIKYRAIERIIKGETFKNIDGPIMGKDY